ncbi:MAG: hypothetical protein MJZ16_09275 [Bacteroidales bacterium]|nr:hypothetical protein [Bacteroidales bacterium]
MLVADAGRVQRIRTMAHEIHANVNQTYADNLPYGFHLDMVATSAMKYGYLVIDDVEDIMPVVFGAYFHDTIEDARMTYNDVVKTASMFFSEQKSVLAAEIVYALTNDKGRTRAERAGEKYYKGIRETPYAPFCKMCDRMANTDFSFSGRDDAGHKMKEVYRSEFPHFLEAITSEIEDIRYSVPPQMIEAIQAIMA